MNEWMTHLVRAPWRYLIAAGVLTAILCLTPGKTAPQTQSEEILAAADEAAPAGADLSERTQEGCYLHRTLYYAACGHSVQRREHLPVRLVGLTRTALEAQIGEVIPGARVTGFSSGEVDISVQADFPCPLHWVLRAGEDGYVHVMQNLTGEAMQSVRRVDIRVNTLDSQTLSALHAGVVFDDVQTMEGYLESLSS